MYINIFIKLAEGRFVVLPTGVKWIAQDNDGSWYGYNKEPRCYVEPSGHNFIVSNVWDLYNDNVDAIVIHLGRTKKPRDWTKELYEVDVNDLYLV